MIDKFKAGTQRNFEEATSQIHLLGLANGSMFASFLLSSIAVPLYGGFLLYDQVRGNGCDPSGAVPGVDTCSPAGADIFGAMFGIFFAASILPQISTTTEAFMDARVACYLALQVMDRTIEKEAPNEERVDHFDDKDPGIKAAVVRRHTGANNIEGVSSLPKYTIDAISPEGLKPKEIRGDIEFDHVTFAYPTRSENKVLDQLSFQVAAGTTVALVGSSGSGKSTIVQLMERFYDPTGGGITLDGTDLRQLNVNWLRAQIGFVNQEPMLFQTTIRENIAYGCPNATMEQVEEAAKIANCHDFIVEFPSGFDTKVGNKGTALSGGTY